MTQINHRGLAEFGLPLVAPGAATFAALVRDIEARPQPFGSWPIADASTAAVLLNETGKAILVLAYFWRYTAADGKTRTSHYSNLGSSMQLDVLCGRGNVVQDLGSFILPGSKRLITEQGMFGYNLDVLPPDFAGRGGGYIGASGSGGSPNRPSEEMAETQLCLDVAILEDGRCVGPDEGGLVEAITRDVQQQHDTAQEIVTALRHGASEGKIFEILLPLARHRSIAPRGIHEHRSIPSPLLTGFAGMAIHRLINAAQPELLAWFEQLAASSPIHLHRPS